MTPEEIKKLALSYKWDRWLERSFGAFIMSIFRHGVSREVMKKTGVDTEYTFFFFEQGSWYNSHEAVKDFTNDIRKYLASGGSIFKITKACEKYRKHSIKQIRKIIKSKIDITEKAKKVLDILPLATSYIWLAHGLEEIYQEILNREVPKYVTEDTAKFIGDMSFPSKKNAHSLMEEDLIKGMKPEKVLEKYGWMKSRDGFSEGYTLDEIIKMKNELQNRGHAEKFKVEIPKPLRKLAKEMQELVYFRTQRTDVYYELLYMCRPIFKELGAKNNLQFQELPDYSLEDLIMGKPKFYPRNGTWICYKAKDIAYFEQPVLAKEIRQDEVLKGSIAFKGIVRGRVKVVKDVSEISKVLAGDILVTTMTFPNFIPAMQKASAFVTDEGGITCHAAIVAREMRKPCVIGTKNATKVLKDNDVVEVDADKGIVKKV